MIGHQEIEADLHDPFFAEDILRARTFCLRKDIEAMWAVGLAKGGSLPTRPAHGRSEPISSPISRK